MSDLILVVLSTLVSVMSGFSIIRLIEWSLPKLPDTRFTKFLENAGLIKKVASSTFQERIEKSMKSLRMASFEVDSVISEASQLADEREKRVTELQNHLDSLFAKETELKNRIATLEKIPVQVIQEFENVLKRDGKRNAIRDYVLFGCGVIFSIPVTIVLKKLGF
jgi:hypothetical protein